MRRWITAALLALFAPHAAAAQDVVAIRNVTVIPVTDAPPIAAQTVVVRDGRIAAIGPVAEVAVPTGAEVLDGTGRYVMPGLIDMHVHTSKTRPSALGLYVVHGVTTVRDQGSEHAEVLQWRQEIRAGDRVGPRMLVAGPYLESLQNIERMRRDPPESRVEPFERARIAVGTPADAHRVVDSLALLELDHLKIRTVQDRETYLALGEAARRHGLRLVGHAVTPSPSLFLESGQSGVDHSFALTLDTLPAAERLAFWRELAARDIAVVPTLVTGTESVLRPLAYYPALVDDSTGSVHPLRPYVSAFLLLDWREQLEELTPQRRAAYERAMPVWLKHVREMHDAGVRLLAGSDVAVLNIFPGDALHEELRLFVDTLGMTPAEALASATRRSAEWLGIADTVGTIEVGRVADLVVLDADPLADIRNTRRIHAVLLRGRLFDRERLDALLRATKAMPDLRRNDWVR